MKIDEIEKRLEAIRQEKELFFAEQDLKNLKSNASRARAVTVGTAFGGVTEVSMRGDSDSMLWCIMQPVEVIELIHQLAGNIGCHINIQPRKDFSSWRDWKVTDEEKLLLNGWPPHPNDIAPHMQLGIKATTPEGVSGINNTVETRNEDGQPLATKKNINKRKSRRAPTAS